MHSFAYKNGTLYCENVNLQELADKESTPLYVYSKQTILNHFHRLREALAPLNAEVAYAVKACSNIAILNLMARNGAIRHRLRRRTLPRPQSRGEIRPNALMPA